MLFFDLSMFSLAVIANILLVSGNMFRLPCQKIANFSIKRDSQIIPNAAIKRFSFLQSDECKAECLLNDNCFSVNYQKESDNVCELNNRTVAETADDNLLIKKDGWILLATNTSYVLVGSNCNQLKPCREEQNCLGKCTCPGFTCIDRKPFDLDKEKVAGLPHKALVQCDMFSSSRKFVVPSQGKDTSFFCAVDDEKRGWVVIQRRIDGSTSFDRRWSEYKSGFGSTDGNYWIGLDTLNKLTATNCNAVLRIDLKLTDNSSLTYTAIYNSFAVDDESKNYLLKIGDYDQRSTLVNSMTSSIYYAQQHNYSMFSTKDRDNDKSEVNCALYHSGGWWFNSCRIANLNGIYKVTPFCENPFDRNNNKYNFWSRLTNCNKQIVSTEMKIRCKHFQGSGNSLKEPT